MKHLLILKILPETLLRNIVPASRQFCDDSKNCPKAAMHACDLENYFESRLIFIFPLFNDRLYKKYTYFPNNYPFYEASPL